MTPTNKVGLPRYLPPLLDQLNWIETPVELPPERLDRRFLGRLRKRAGGSSSPAEITPEPARIAGAMET